MNKSGGKMKRLLLVMVCLLLMFVVYARADNTSDNNVNLIQAALDGNLQLVNFFLDHGASPSPTAIISAWELRM